MQHPRIRLHWMQRRFALLSTSMVSREHDLFYSPFFELTRLTACSWDMVAISLIPASTLLTLYLYWSHLIRYSFLALVIYDYLLTVQDEWTYVWRRMNFSAATVIFIINRYLVIPIIALQQSLMWSSSVELSNAVSLSSFDVPKSKNNLKISVFL